MSHIHEKIDFTVEVFIVYRNTVLLMKHDKYDIWLGIGGHIEPDEDPIQAAVREVKEEVGLDVKLVGDKKDFIVDDFQELLAPNFMNRHRISDTHEHVAFTYFATSTSDKIVQGDTERSEEWKWFTAKELHDTTFGIKAHIVHYALTALKVVS